MSGGRSAGERMTVILLSPSKDVLLVVKLRASSSLSFLFFFFFNHV